MSVTQVPVCHLCLSTPATQTGSHLLSAFMVESLAGKRGEERTYQISGGADFDYTQNVGASSIVSDNILCIGCEKRLGYVESYISQELIQKISLKAQAPNFPIIKNEVPYIIKDCLRVNSSAFFLFIASLLFRISLSDSAAFKKFKLKSDEYQLIRRTLHRLLPPYNNFKVKPDKNQWLLFIKTELQKQQFFSFTLISSKSKFNGTANIVLTPHFIQYPYTLILNEFILLVYFGELNFSNIEEDYFYLGSVMFDSVALNVIDETIRIAFINDQIWMGIITRMNTMLKEQKLDALGKYFSAQFLLKNHRLPTSAELSLMILNGRLSIERT